MRLAGKVALVTGAQQGIGRAIALAMAGEGADVGLNFLDDPGAAERVAGEIRGCGRKVLTVKGDVAQARDVQALVDTVAGALGPPDILVNNAGVFPRSAFLELTEREWRAMVAAGRPGAIVNISSSAIRGDARGVHYSASKGGVLGMTRAMALALAPHRIRVNAIAPGLTDTAQPRYGNTEEQIAERAREIPLGRIAQPEEIARIAVFLASEDSGWITGELIHVNGGAYMA